MVYIIQNIGQEAILKVSDVYTEGLTKEIERQMVIEGINVQGVADVLKCSNEGARLVIKLRGGAEPLIRVCKMLGINRKNYLKAGW